MASASADAQALIAQIGKSTSRDELLALSYQLTAALETPRDALRRITWEQVRFGAKH